ncbi:P-loop containing nucleoside triphosphate hydrolase protein [Mucor mucedo]|uniref:P-loop containing nucleoside triphosphate hydrolase protein n=1 Tax=Mucor mucedo TaxID=29922 RepID=UPI002221096D|nr:P-loop containing nucleoside triphosphate hydrolase protein [Mucor mucedo]KAI7890994.1 P-loop containing nucleoside triphosphate hydrolase protein [Mucor mucedo]
MPRINSDIDPSHIIKRRKRTRTVTDYNETTTSNRPTTRQTKPSVRQTKTRTRQAKAPAPAPETKPLPRQSKPLPRQAKPLPRQAKPLPRQAKPLPSQAKPSTQQTKPPSSKVRSKSPARQVDPNSSEVDEPETESDEESEAEVKSEEDSESESEEESESEPESEVEETKKSRRPTTLKKRKVAVPSRHVAKNKPTLSANRTIHRINQVAPVVPLRKVHEKSDISSMTPYALARERLHVSAVPDSLPCREDEFMNILGYIESAIHEATGTCVYISGVPGTGKTATVLEVIRHLQHQAEEKTIPQFDFVEINGMKLTDPNQAYSILWECMDRNEGKQKRYTASHALQMLEAKFSKQSNDQRTTVVLMDELDLLVTKKQTVMYNFFDWPSRPLSKLIVVAVANTMDLPERIMSNKIASRMGLTRINFQPYKFEQIIQIVQSRLKGIDAFTPSAVEFAARKVSAVSGDARRALDICRRAVEIVETRPEMGTHVTIPIVTEAVKEMFTSPSVAFIRSCSLHQKIFLVACMQRSRAIGLVEIEFGDVAHYHIQTCKWHNIEPPNTSDLMRVCESLGQTNALVMEGGRMDICMRLSLNLAEEDIVMACKADKLISRLLQNLPSH